MPSTSSLREFTLRVLVVAAIAALALLLWRILDVLLLAFGATLFAILLLALAEPIRRRTGWPGQVALAVAVGFVLAVLAAAGWLFGHEVGRQLGEIAQRLPRAWESIREWLQQYGLGVLLLRGMENANADLGGLASLVPKAAAAASTAALHLLLVVFGGVYLAANPALYRRGLLKLLPERARPPVAGFLDTSARALRLWLRGQLITMALVGLLTGLGLWLAGVPAPLALGLLAGLLEFIPYIGPILAAVPGMLLGLTVGPEATLLALLVYVVVQQLEANLILPLVERQVLQLPPALVIFSVVALGLVFGILGLIFAAPLTVLLVTAVGQLYVRDALGTPTQVPGERDRSS
jgi:predicted PurR-regulated permease PerM